MSNSSFSKGFVLGVILLCVAASVIPVFRSNLLTGRINDNGVPIEENNFLRLDAASWQWAVKAGGISDDESWGICMDSQGNTYVTGYFRSSAVFGSTTLISSGESDVFVAKLNSNGVFQWAVRAGGASEDIGRGICVDSAGNVYVTGWFKETALFGSTTLVSSGESDVFVAKLNSNGVFQWAVGAGGVDEDYSMDISVDSAANTYITGYFKGIVLFGSITLTSHGAMDAFVAKLSVDGVWQWAVSAGGTDGDEGRGICVDATGNVYITGYFWGTAVFGSTSLISSGESDVFVAKLNSNGVFQWAVKGGGANGDGSWGIGVDAAGDIIVTGYFESTAVFGVTTLTSQGGYDVFVGKLSNNGAWQWAVKGGGANGAFGYGICADTVGSIYITGYFYGKAVFGSTTLISQHYDVFVAKLSPTGIWQWAIQSMVETADNLAEGRGICTDENGNTYVTGYFYGKTLFGVTTLTSQGGYDVFVVKFSPGSGNPPILGSPTPLNGSTGNPLSFTWSIPISDPQGDQFSWSIQSSNGQSASGSAAMNGTKTLSLSELSYSTSYTIWVNATDPGGSGLFTQRWFTFSTLENTSGGSNGGGNGGGGNGGGIGGDDGDEEPPAGPELKRPVADTSAGEPYQGHVNAAVTFDGSKSHSPNGNITRWYWTFGDNTDGTGMNIQHMYSKKGTYDVTLTVTDEKEATNTTMTICMIALPDNRPPTKPFITGPIAGMTNIAYSFTALSTDPDNDEIKYTFDWGDSRSQSSGFVPNGTSVSLDHSWLTPGSYTITVTVTDNQTAAFSQMTIHIKAAAEEKPATPGFELLFLICATAVALLVWRKKRKV